MNRVAFVEVDRDGRRRDLSAVKENRKRFFRQRFEASARGVELSLGDPPVTVSIHWREQCYIVAGECQPHGQLFSVEFQPSGAQPRIVSEGGSRRQDQQNQRQADRRPETLDQIGALHLVEHLRSHRIGMGSFSENASLARRLTEKIRSHESNSCVSLRAIRAPSLVTDTTY